VALTFVQFATELNYDFVKLYDGRDCTASLIAALSGSQIPTQFYSTQQYMFIEFISDSSVVLSGFNATYQSIMSTSTPTPSEYEYAAFR
jgi:CUB domain